VCMKHEPDQRPGRPCAVEQSADGFWTWGSGSLRPARSLAEGELRIRMDSRPAGVEVSAESELRIRMDQERPTPARGVVCVKRDLDGPQLVLTNGSMEDARRRAAAHVLHDWVPVDLVELVKTGAGGTVGRVIARMVPGDELDALDAGVDELDAILEQLHGEALAKAGLDPTKPADFDKISRSLARGLQDNIQPRKWKGAAHALRKLEGVDWVNLPLVKRQKVVAEATRLAGGMVKEALPMVGESVKVWNQKTIDGTRRVLEKTLGMQAGMFTSGFGAKDVAAMQALRRQAGHFVTTQAGQFERHVSTLAMVKINGGISDGLGTAQIADDLMELLDRKKDVLGIARTTREYARVVSMAWVNDSRSWGQVSGYDAAGIQYYVIEAVLDEATTEQCRFLHGKRFPTAQGLKYFSDRNEAKAAGDPMAIKRIQPWLRVTADPRSPTGKMITAQPPGGRVMPVAEVLQSGMGHADRQGTHRALLSDQGLGSQGFGLPPFHGRCRTTTVPDVSMIQVPAAGTVPIPPPGAVKPKPGPVGKYGGTLPQKRVANETVNWKRSADEWDGFLGYFDESLKGAQAGKTLLPKQRRALLDAVFHASTDGGALTDSRVLASMDARPFMRAVSKPTKTRPMFINDRIRQGVDEFMQRAPKVLGRYEANGGQMEPFLVRYKKGRAKYSPWDASGKTIYTQGATRSTMHEFGHHLEDVSERAHQACLDFVRDRTEGEKAVRLKDLFPRSKYRANEVTKVDKFISPYVGKDYDGRFTEVLSMGFENFSSDDAIVWLFENDPEHFRLTLAMITGTI